VLEALSGHLADLNGYLESIAAAQRIAIAARENSLGSPESAGASGVTSASVPGAGAMSASSAAAGSPSELPETAGGGPSMSRM
jgi:hypothetical protein